MPHENKIDELNLQRLVDNELSHDQVRQLLAEAEFGDDATKWKQIALAFTEDQMFKRAFDQHESVQTVEELLVADAPVVERPERLATPPTEVPPTGRAHNWWAAVLAASLLLAMTVAYQVSRPAPKLDNNSLVNSSPTVDSPTTVSDSRAIESFDRMTLASYEPDHQLEAKDIASASVGKHSSSIPLYDLSLIHI